MEIMTDEELAALEDEISRNWSAIAAMERDQAERIRRRDDEYQSRGEQPPADVFQFRPRPSRGGPDDV